MPVQFTDLDDLPGSNPAKSEFGTVPIYDRAAMSRRKRLKASAAPTATAAASQDFTLAPASKTGSRGAPAWVLMAVPAAIVLAGGAFVLMQPRAANEPETMSVAAMDSVTPQPPASATTMPELAPAPDATAAAQTTAAAATSAATPPARAERAPEPARVARARPAPRAPAADESSADAGATVPSTAIPSTKIPSTGGPQPVGAQPNPLAVNPTPLASPSVTEPSVASDARPAPAAETSGATQEVIPDASAIPQ